MFKDSLNLCSILVLLAILSKFAAFSETDISYQIGEFNKKLDYLQGRLDLFDYITEGNVSVLLHRVEVKDLKCAENVTVHMNETNMKLNNLGDSYASVDARLNVLESKFNALATTITNFVGAINETLRTPLSSCIDAFARPLLNRGSGVYNIQFNGNSLPYEVYCMADPQGGLPWTIVQRRVDGSVDFYRNWAEYQRGFGDLENNFFIGLDKLHFLTTKGEPQELWVKLTAPDGITRHAHYDRFAIGNEANEYPLEVLGKHSGDAADSLTYHKSMKFSTYDNNNDLGGGKCANINKSAWWFRACHTSNLNGVYGSSEYNMGVNWDNSDDAESMKYAHMAIRPARK